MPRLGMGMPIIGGATEAAVLAVEDFVFLNDVSGELTPVDTSSRTNLLLQSQTFKTTWTTNNAAIPNDLYKAPDDSLTAQAITATSAGASGVYVQQVVATTAGETYTYSAHVKAGANGFVLLLFFDGNLSRTAYFNTATGAASNTSDVLTTSFDKMDDGWFRVSITFQNTVTTSSSFVRIFPAAAAGSTATGAAFQAGTELMYLWGAQLEENSEMSAYIVTTNAAITTTETLNDTSETWDFDSADLMPEADPDDDGVWEVPANVVLNGDYEELGSEEVTNGDFSTDSDWSKGDGWSISGGKAVAVVGTSSRLEQSISGLSGKYCKVNFTISDYGGSGSVYIDFGSTNSSLINTNGEHTVYGAFDQNKFEIFKGGAFSGSIDNVSIKQVDPNNRWVLGTGWSISDGKAVAVATSSSGFSITQNNILTSNTQYEITYTLSDITAGSVRFRANLVSGTQRGSNGTYTEIITTAGDDFAFQGLDSFVGKIDNVTVREYAITPLDV